MSDERTTPSLPAALREWFTSPPRAHGDQRHDRVVSFLELFYDLVFVVLIAQISNTLAAHVSWSGVRDFAIVFGLIWIAWANGSLYHELHGREDGRGRTGIFGQMMLLVLAAVYATHAADDLDDGRGFALTFAALLAVLALQWWSVRAHDVATYRPLIGRYVAGSVAAAVAMAASALTDDIDLRLWIWAGVVVLTVAGVIAFNLTLAPEHRDVFTVTESTSERFGLFTIIVLGEVVVGVTDGLSEADRDITTIAVGLFALWIGFGLWWLYFDLAGRRSPVDTQPRKVTWIHAHLPLAGGIAASGAAFVGLIGHAGDGRTSSPTAWLIAGAVATTLLSLAVLVSTLEPHAGSRTAPVTLTVGAAVALVLGWVRPDPLWIAILLAALPMLIWLETFASFARAGERLDG